MIMELTITRISATFEESLARVAGCLTAGADRHIAKRNAHARHGRVTHRY